MNMKTPPAKTWVKLWIIKHVTKWFLLQNLKCKILLNVWYKWDYYQLFIQQKIEIVFKINFLQEWNQEKWSKFFRFYKICKISGISHYRPGYASTSSVDLVVKLISVKTQWQANNEYQPGADLKSVYASVINSFDYDHEKIVTIQIQILIHHQPGQLSRWLGEGSFIIINSRL